MLAVLIVPDLKLIQSFLVPCFGRNETTQSQPTLQCAKEPLDLRIEFRALGWELY